MTAENRQEQRRDPHPAKFDEEPALAKPSRALQYTSIPPTDFSSLFRSSWKGAIFSDDRRYRYFLWRVLDPTKPAVNFIGLTPSTADELVNDQMIRRCLAFAKAWNYGAVWMTDIYGFRSTDPKGLKETADAVGPFNDLWIKRAARESGLIVPCWGQYGGARGRQVLAWFPDRVYHLGLNVDGSPRHPSRLPNNVLPTPFSNEREIVPPECLFEQYNTWAKRKRIKCRVFAGYVGIHRTYRLTSRATILRDAGFRPISGGTCDPCTRRTAEAAVVKPPRQAVMDFVDGSDYSEVLYYPDDHDPLNLIVWAK